MTELQTPSLHNRQLLPNADRSRYLQNITKASLALLALHGFFNLALWLKVKDLSLTQKTYTLFKLADSAIVFIPNFVLPVFFLLWTARAYANLHRAGLPYLRHAPGWAVGAWFVPLMNFYRPYTIMKEIWHRTQDGFLPAGTPTRPHTVIRYWWLCFWAPALVSFVCRLSIGTSGSTTAFYEADFASLAFAAVFQVLSIFFLTVMVRSLSQMEEAFAQRFGEAQADEVARMAEHYRGEQAMVGAGHGIAGFAPWEQPVQESKVISGEVIETMGPGKVIIACFGLLLFVVVPFAVSDCLLMGSGSTNAGVVRFANSIAPTLMVVLALVLPLLAVTFILWLNRSYNNLRNVRVEKLSVARGTQSGRWILPFVNIYFAWSMMREIKKHSQTALTTLEEEPEPLPLLDWSWTAFLLGGFLLLLVNRLTNGTGYMGPDAGLAMVLNICGYLLFIFGFIGAMLVMRKLNRIQALLFQRIESAVDKDTAITYEKTSV